MMIAPTLPAELKAALEAKLEGFSRIEAAGRAARISDAYRAGGTSGTIRSESDALAYALARMPATYAAVAASLDALADIVSDFVPNSLLDVGAGPGTASWAAAEAFASLNSFVLLDANDALRRLALDLSRSSTRLRGSPCVPGDVSASLAEVDAADLVIASYLIGEISEADQSELAELMWAKTGKVLLVVEPGTPAGFARILALRSRLIAAGGHVVAPCPHDGICPLTPPDWCHFSQRLPRLKAHKDIKGAELPFEDEKFAYVALSRVPVPSRRARVLAPPVAGKAEIIARLCTADGLAQTRVPRRDKVAYANARRWRWGNAVMDKS